MNHILTLDICGNVTQQNNDQKAVLPDEQFIKKPADLVEGFLYYNEDTKQFEFSETELDEVTNDPAISSTFYYTVRHPLYGAGVTPTDDDSSNPAKIYKVGCVAPDKANYGNYCIWDGPKIIYKTINRTIYPPYSDIIKIEKWKFGKNTGNVLAADMGQEGPDGVRTFWSGIGKSSKYYNEDGTEKPQTDQ
jgi:hypothetical protein